jgi:hypothetical protein
MLDVGFVWHLESVIAPACRRGRYILKVRLGGARDKFVYIDFSAYLDSEGEEILSHSARQDGAFPWIFTRLR